MRDRPLLLVVDEPTGTLDAETEHILFERYAAAAHRTAAAGRITRLVSHCFSAARRADRIVVLDGSRVVEVDPQEELRSRRGPYAELYGLQAAAYRWSAAVSIRCGPISVRGWPAEEALAWKPADLLAARGEAAG